MHGVCVPAVSEPDVRTNEPLHQPPCGSLGKQVHWPVSLKIAQDGAVALPTPQRPIVDAQDMGRGDLRFRQTADDPQQMIRAGRQAQLPGQPCTRLTAAGQRNVTQRFMAAPRRACVMGGHLGQPFGENPPQAPAVIAEESPAVPQQPDASALTGEVGQGSRVVAVNPRRSPATQRAGTTSLSTADVNRHNINSNLDLPTTKRSRTR